jgi:hypothetical protein
LKQKEAKIQAGGKAFCCTGLCPAKACSAIPYRTVLPQAFTPKAVPPAAFARFYYVVNGILYLFLITLSF